MIGGSRAEMIKQGKYRVKSLKRMRKIIVEGFTMVRELKSLVFNNFVRVPNFKPIDYKASITHKKEGDVMRFVFFSRMHPAKGVN